MDNKFNDIKDKTKSFIERLTKGIVIGGLIIAVLFFIGFEIFSSSPINFNNTFIMLIIIGIIWLALMAIPLNFNFKIRTTGIIILVIALGFGVNLVASKMFSAKSHAALIGNIEEVKFDDVYNATTKVETSYIDKDAALVAADKKIGELADLASIYEVDGANFSKIIYKGKLVRIAPLKFSLTNYKFTQNDKGIPYYILVEVGGNRTSAKAELINVEDTPVKYHPNAMFFKKLDRVAFMHNPTYTYGTPAFELDESGAPYWSIPIIKHKILKVDGEYVDGIILVNATTGKVKEYQVDEVPSWVDRVYPTDLLLNNAATHYTYKNGFLASINWVWSSKVGLKTIDTSVGDYNYITLDNEIYVFTGVRPQGNANTSTTSLLYISTKTGKVRELELSGVSLAAARKAATESVAEKDYTATTPSLISVDGHPTYVMTLKGESGTTYGFSMVNYEDLNLNAFGNSLAEVRKAYLNVMGGNGTPAEELTLEGEYVIEGITSATVDGNTNYFIKFADRNDVYVASITVNDELPFMKSGDKVYVMSSGKEITIITYPVVSTEE